MTQPNQYEEGYIYFVKRQGQDATVRQFLKDPITPEKVKVLDNGDILYRFLKPESEKPNA